MFKIVDVQMMNMCMIMSESNFEEDSFDSNILDNVRYTISIITPIWSESNADSTAE